MAERREVNTNRPEHSWIPFYRELAEGGSNTIIQIAINFRLRL